MLSAMNRHRLTDAYAFIKMLNRDYKLSNFHVITNMVQTVQQGEELFQKLTKVTDHYLDVTLRFLGAVLYNDFLRKAVQKQTPVVVAFPGSKAFVAVKKIAGKIDTSSRSQPRQVIILSFLLKG